MILKKHVDSTYCNPVKHGYVEHALDWPSSSIHGHMAKEYLKEGRGKDGEAELSKVDT